MYQNLVLFVLIISIINEEYKTTYRGFNLRRVYITIILFLLSFALFPLVYADRGLISITPGVSVYEPGQKAILAWNGQEEIMILSTDVNASQQTLVLEILPLPSKPQVETATFHSFEEIQDMIWEEAINLGMYNTVRDAKSGSIEVVFHEQIGAHNITAVKANNSLELLNWTRNFLAENGQNETISLGNFAAIVEDYMGRGFRYYVLDLITFSSEEKSIDPILYRFNSTTLYYPLLITSPVGGHGKITLFTITKEKVEGYYWPLEFANYQVFGNAWQRIEFALSRGDLSKIDLRIGELFPDGARLSVLTFDGPLSSLTRDIMISADDLDPTSPPLTNIQVTMPPTLFVLCILLGTVSALLGAILTFLVTRQKKP